MGQQGRFWEMHGLLFGNQQSFDDGSLNDHARRVSARLPDFQACIEQNTMLSRIRAQIGIGQAAGVNSTPTFFVGRFETSRTVRVLYRLNGAQSYALFAYALKEAIQSM
jgi:protein-disulfide isomerase